MLFGLGKKKEKSEKSKSASNSSLVGTKRGNKEAGTSASSSSSKLSGNRAGDKARGGRKLRLPNAGTLSGSVNKLFHGVAVRPRGEACCSAVDALGAQRFLSEDAPLLPLAKCSDPKGCRCVYEHFDERRDNLRRETDIGLPERLHPEEKRDGSGRRITDG